MIGMKLFVFTLLIPFFYLNHNIIYYSIYPWIAFCVRSTVFQWIFTSNLKYIKDINLDANSAWNRLERHHKTIAWVYGIYVSFSLVWNEYKWWKGGGRFVTHFEWFQLTKEITIFLCNSLWFQSFFLW